jgi:hypothetical protein
LQAQSPELKPKYSKKKFGYSILGTVFKKTEKEKKLKRMPSSAALHPQHICSSV